jgi:hypothetical protein
VEFHEETEKANVSDTSANFFFFLHHPNLKFISTCSKTHAAAAIALHQSRQLLALWRVTSHFESVSSKEDGQEKKSR